MLENHITYQIPFLNLSSVDLYGFLTNNNGISESHNIQFYGSRTLSNPLFFPEGIFDNYKLSVWLNCCNDSPLSYNIVHFGQPENREFPVPNYSASLISPSMVNFLVETDTQDDYSMASFFDNLGSGNIYDDTYRFNIHNLGNNTISFSNKATLFNNIFTADEIQSSTIEFRSLKLIKNTYSSGEFSKYIQSQIEEKEEFPEGTFIESGSFFLFSFN